MRAISPPPARIWFFSSLVLAIVVWELGARSGFLNPFFFASPSAVGATAVSELDKSRFWSDLLATSSEFFIGFLAAVAAGIPVGLLVGSSRRLRYVVGPWIDGLNATPQIAFLPLVLLWVGLGPRAAIVIAFISAFFAIVINTEDGTRAVQSTYLDLARSFGASRPKTYTSIVLPATLPYVVTGLRIGVGRALISVFVAELFAGSTGIGYLIKLGGQTLQTDRVFFGVLVFVILGLILFAIVGMIEARFQHWRPSSSGGRLERAHG